MWECGTKESITFFLINRCCLYWYSCSGWWGRGRGRHRGRLRGRRLPGKKNWYGVVKIYYLGQLEVKDVKSQDFLCNSSPWQVQALFYLWPLTSFTCQHITEMILNLIRKKDWQMFIIVKVCVQLLYLDYHSLRIWCSPLHKFWRVSFLKKNDFHLKEILMDYISYWLLISTANSAPVHLGALFVSTHVWVF